MRIPLSDRVKLLFFRLFQICFCGLAALLLACESPEELGTGFDLDLLNTTFTDTITIDTEITLADSVNTTSSPNLLFGGYTDPDFGNSQFEFYAELGFFDDSIKFVDKEGNLAIYDSLIVYLPVVTVNGDSAKKQTIDVFRLTETLGAKDTYYQFSKLAYNPIPIGSAVYPTQMSNALKDSKLKDDAPSLRVRVNDELGKEIFSKSGQSELRTDSLFREYFKGIRVASRERDAAILSFPATFGGSSGSNLQISYIGMIMHYHYTRIDKTKDGRDSLVTVKKSKGFGFNFNRFLNIKYDFSSSRYLRGLVPGGSINSRSTGNMGFILNGVGISTKMRFPYLKQMFAGKRMMINKADLFLTPDADAIAKFRTAPSALQFIKLAANGRPATFSDGSLDILLNESASSATPLSMLYVPNGRAYTNAQMTFYVQNILNNKIENNGLVFAPSGNASTSNRLLFFDNAHPRMADRLRLRLYYTSVE